MPAERRGGRLSLLLPTLQVVEARPGRRDDDTAVHLPGVSHINRPGYGAVFIFLCSSIIG